MARKELCRLLLAAALALGAGAAFAGNAREVRRTLESSMLVTGHVVIQPDGTVARLEVDPRIQLDAPLQAFIEKAAARWKFAPVEVDGKVVTAKVPLSLRLVAKPVEDGDGVRVRIASTQFGAAETHAPPGSMVEVKSRASMAYPLTALRMGGKGTAYLLVRVGRDGRAMDVEAEQVNLRVVGTTQQMDVLRKEFAQASVQGVRRWTFTVPTTGPEANAPFWVGRIAVNYVLGRETRSEVGHWDTYVPGPRNTSIPWAEQRLRTAGSPDAVPEGGFRPLDGGVRLLTPADAS